MIAAAIAVAALLSAPVLSGSALADPPTDDPTSVPGGEATPAVTPEPTETPGTGPSESETESPTTPADVPSEDDLATDPGTTEPEVQDLEQDETSENARQPLTVHTTKVSAQIASPPGSTTRNGQSFYAYVGAGENFDVRITKSDNTAVTTNIPVNVRGPGGFTQTCSIGGNSAPGTTCDMQNMTSSTPGVWKAEVVGPPCCAANIDNYTWTVRVQNGASDISGRVWTDRHSMSQDGNGINFSIWYRSEQGFDYKVDYRNYQGVVSILSSTAVGAAKIDTCESAYRSYDTDNATSTTSAFYVPFDQCGEPYHLFFEAPDPAMPAIATAWDGSTAWVDPEIVLPTLDNLAFDQSAGSISREGEFSVDVTNFVGNAEMQIDANNDGDYTDDVDRVVPFAVTADGQQTIPFDGEDGEGTLISVHADFRARAVIDQVGEIHFPNWDVETRGGGLEVTALDGPSQGSKTLYWNDTQLPTSGKSCVPSVSARDGRQGVNSSGGVHGWCGTGTNPWGNQRLIDDWTYQVANIQDDVEVAAEPTSCEGVYALQGASPFSVYHVDTATGDMAVVGQVAAGAASSTNNNGMGISADARYVFTHRNGTVFKFDTQTGDTESFTGESGLNATHGAVNPATGVYYYGNINDDDDGATVYAFDTTTNTSLGQVATINFGRTSPGGNGDWAFDRQGNLYLTAGSATSNDLYVVSQALPTTSGPSVTRSATRLTGITTTQAINGLAFGADGFLYPASSGTIFKINPSTGVSAGSKSLTPSGVSVDLASCASPSTITVQKDVVGRVRAGDQFALSVTGGGIAAGNTGTTTGTDTGIQSDDAETAGPVLGLPGTQYTVAETAVGGTNLAAYTTTWKCVDVADGDAVVAQDDGTTGSFTMPTATDGIGGAIVCTFKNTPPEPQDFGDAPESYGTTVDDDGARHDVVGYDAGAHTASLMLGARVDPEDDGAPTADASGDDTAGVDDEGGVADPIVLTAGSPTSVTVAVTNDTAQPATLAGWIDLDRDGAFDALERATATVPANAGSVARELSFAAASTDGDTYARFRLFSGDVTDPDPTGEAGDGEVEDYPVTIQPGGPVVTCDTDAAMFNTAFDGLDDAADDTLPVGSRDLNWEVGVGTGNGGPSSVSSYVPAFVIPPVAGAWDPSPFGNADWISYNTNGQHAARIDLYFRYRFRIDPNVPLGGLALQMDFMADNSVPEVWINGTPQSPTQDGLPQSTTAPYTHVGFKQGNRASTVLSEGFQHGANEIVVRVASDPGFVGFMAQMQQSPLCNDWGDAPISYGTDSGADGASHGRSGISGSGDPMLGDAVDLEPEGLPGPLADGDDTDGVDDEDGVEFNPSLGYADPTIRTGTDPITLGPVSNTVTVDASADGFVSAWVDWNLDGDFADADERVADAQPVTAGLNDLTFSQGTNPADIRTYVRVRYSTDAPSIAQPTGPAPDGEVEDYRVLVERLVTPSACTPVSEPYYAMTFTTVTDKVGSGGVGTSARFPDVTVVEGVPVDMVMRWMSGNSINGNSFNPAGDDAQWQLNAGGAAAQIGYDFYEAGTTTPIEVNGVWTVNDMDNGERVRWPADQLSGFAVTPGSQVMIAATSPTVDLRGTVSGNGDVRSRFQVWFEDKDHLDAIWNGFSFSGFTADGDGDIPVPKSCDDYGDAPDTYQTLLDSDGPRHLVRPDLRMGAEAEFDGDGQPGPGADGDDLNRVDDEDGVTDPIVMTAGEPTTVRVTTTNDTGANATLAGWLDLDGDGTFEIGERVIIPVGAGTAEYPLVFPPGPSTTTTAYARFRLYPGTVTDAVPTGAAVAGEVEDYPVQVLGRGLEITKTSDATADSRPGDTITYTVTATNTGDGDFTAANPARVIDDLTAVLDDATYNSDASADVGADPVYAEPRLTWSGALAAGGTVTITYTVTLKGGGDGIARNVAWGVDPGDSPGPTPDCDSPSITVPCDDEELELPRLSISKAADRTDLPAVGGELTYTVTVRNDGPGDYTAAAPATFTDDLSEVLDDATFVGGSTTQTVGSATFADPTLSWSGVLASGETATITYRVKYTGAGDHQLDNLACVPGEQALDRADACVVVRVPGSGLEQRKSASPASGTAVDVGDEITYTLTFVNTGATAATVDTTDDLSDVLDDAVLVAGPDAGAGLTADLDGETLEISGSVPTGETRTVTYRVRVKPYAAQGDHVLRNALACQPGDPASCEPETTEHPVRALEVTKTSDATASMRPGDVVTYTVTARNLGPGDYPTLDPAVVVDDLAGVLDDATYNGDATATIGGTPVAAPDYLAPRMAWTGALAAGQTVRITFSVTLKGGGDGLVDNVVWAPDPGDPHGPTPDCDAPATTVPCDEEHFRLPKLSITKDADPDAVTAAGQEVTFTVKVTNDGPGDYTAAAPATFTDDLSKVLDDATFVPGSITATTGAAAFTSPTLSWSGVLAAGESATVTYRVRYTGEGNRSLVNSACVPEDEATDTGQDCATVTVAGAGLSQTKTSDPASGTTVSAGDRITYTLTFTNTGSAPATVDTSDDLSGVLDDATLVAGPTATDGLTAVRAGDQIRITGSVPPGQTRTVTYTVEVESFDAQADHVLRNALACQAGAPAECEPERTEHPVGHLTVTKTNDATADVDTGDTVTYTITVRNDGTAAIDPAEVRDDLSDVLDDATYNGDATADRGTVTFATPTLTWKGALQPGRTATITYSVTVTNQGDHDLGNVASVPDCDEPGCNPPPVVTELPYVVPSKTTDVAPGGSVQAGDVVTYTLSWTNNGKTPGVVDATDDLSDVLDDADLVEGPTSSSSRVTATLAGSRLRIVGPIDPGETVTVTYKVRVKPAGERGDNELGNELTPDTPQVDCDGDECEPVDPPVTEDPLGELDDSKTVDPADGSAVTTGDLLTYTLTFTNTGAGPVDVAREDDLSDVLDDATLVSGPTSSSPALQVAGPDGDGRISITGTLEPDQTVTVTYTVRVKPDRQRGNDELSNFLVDPGEDPPPSCNVRGGRAAAGADCTENPAGDVDASKDVNLPHDSTVQAGDELEFTLTFTNTRRGPVKVDYVDALADVLDDATMVSGPTSSSPALDVAREGDRLIVTGTLAPGQTVRVTYTMKVKADGQRGNGQLINYLFPEGGAPTSACEEDRDDCTANAVSPANVGTDPDGGPGGDLPDTGARFGPWLIAVGVLCLLLGAWLVVASRRGRDEGEPEAP